MTPTITVDVSKDLLSLDALGKTAGKEMDGITMGMAKTFSRLIFNSTPPAHAGVTGLAAKKHGERTIEGDIRRVYATPAKVYEEIARFDPVQAKLFYLHLKRGDYAKAAEVMAAANVRPAHVAPFDGGALHQRQRTARGRVPRGRRPFYVVSNPQALKTYVEGEKKKVGQFAAGWNEPAQKFGVTPPAWVLRHGSRFGNVKIINAPGGLSITIRNPGRLSKALDMQRRADYVRQYAVNGAQRKIDFLARKLNSTKL